MTERVTNTVTTEKPFSDRNRVAKYIAFGRLANKVSAECKNVDDLVALLTSAKDLNLTRQEVIDALKIKS